MLPINRNNYYNFTLLRHMGGKPACDYCGRQCESDEHLTQHLTAQHDPEELSRIDRKRVEQYEQASSSQLGERVPDVSLSRRATLGIVGVGFVGGVVGLGGSAMAGEGPDGLPALGQTSTPEEESPIVVEGDGATLSDVTVTDLDIDEIDAWLNEEPNRLDVLAQPPEGEEAVDPGEGEVDWGDGVWDGELVDETGKDEVDINFSAMLEIDGAPLGPFAVDPIAVDISPGTTVKWEWQGEHTLTSYFDPPHEGPEPPADDEFEVPGEEDELNTHEYTFNETGVYLYYCFPHGTPYVTPFGPAGTDGTENWFGHRGAIRVVEE